MSQITDRSYWKSVEAKEGDATAKTHVDREFPVDASVLEDPVSRRTFLKIMGASMALVGASGCTLNIRKPVRTIRPYVKGPEYVVPGKPVYYASSVGLGLDVVGLLAQSHEGRPTKIEGNPEHSMSQGAANALHQASVLNLYDPDRLKTPLFQKETSTLGAFKKWILEHSAQWRRNRGQGVAILTDENASPTYRNTLAALKKSYPLIAIHRYSAVNEDASISGLSQVFGKPVIPFYNFQNADRILAFDADFLGVDLGNVRYSKDFSSRRTPEGDMSRLYIAESHYSVTGGKADHRFRLSPDAIEGLVVEISSRILAKTGAHKEVLSVLTGFTGIRQSGLPGITLEAIVQDLLSAGNKSLLLAGPRLPDWVHALTALVNHALGATNTTVSYRPATGLWSLAGASLGSIQDLTVALADKKVDTLFILGGNPVYDAPAQLDFENLLAKIPVSVHLTDHANETSAYATWQIPRSHFLETWSDLTAIDGSVVVGQPLIAPLYASLSDLEILSLIDGRDAPSFSMIRDSHRTLSDAAWRRALHNGIFSTATAGISLPLHTGSLISSLNAVAHAVLPSGLRIVFRPDFKIYDGRFANNGWLQELPDPVTKLTWDNAALISRSTAKKLGLDSHKFKGPLATVNSHSTPSEVTLATLTIHGRTIKTAVLVQPGHADDTVTLLFGYGRKNAGRVGNKAGFDVYPVFEGQSMAFGATLTALPETYKISVTQDHWSLEGRPLYREGSLATYTDNPEFAKEMVEHPPLLSSWKEKAYDTGYQWGMAIDLNKCTGCNACLIACQSENTIPIVGKDQVAMGREMHWIRLDRYYEGTEEDAVMVQQPVTCLQCENAPCEQVCPVAATTHSSDGLNDMAYNRCIGTKYCSNNCPVKVRRFNFLDYHQRNPQATNKDRIHLFDYMKEPDKTVQKQFNPNVTVRMRGVMEKCTYCVQRISSTRIVAKNEGRAIQDLEIQTACMQTCPSDAIVFGNILDPDSQVSKVKAQHRDYHMLSELNLKPRTSYLAAIRNPNPALESAERVS